MDCPVCNDLPAVFLFHCGHGLCHSCIHQMCIREPPPLFKCPICRSTAEHHPILIRAFAEVFEATLHGGSIREEVARVEAHWILEQRDPEQEQEQEQNLEQEEEQEHVYLDGSSRLACLDFRAPFENLFGYQEFRYYMTHVTEVNNRTLEICDGQPFYDGGTALREPANWRNYPFTSNSILVRIGGVRSINNMVFERSIFTPHCRLVVRTGEDQQQLLPIRHMEDAVRRNFPFHQLVSVINDTIVTCYSHIRGSIVHFDNRPFQLVLACRGFWTNNTHAGIRLHLMTVLYS